MKLLTDHQTSFIICRLKDNFLSKTIENILLLGFIILSMKNT